MCVRKIVSRPPTSIVRSSGTANALVSMFPRTAYSGACTASCAHATCGDGHTWLGVEACDDANTDSGDGCRADCRKVEACEAVVKEIEAQGGEAVAFGCNIGDKAQLQALVDFANQRYGRVDTLVCNAAVNPYFGPSTGVSDEVFDKIIGCNVRSNFQLANMVMPQMAERGGGSIIIVSSIGGLIGSDVIGAYNVSKAADFQLARNLAIEFGPHNVRVNAIAPGVIRTDFARALWEDPKAEAELKRVTPLGRIGEPENIAGAAVFLASRAGEYVTGQAIVVDGGTTIKGGL